MVLPGFYEQQSQRSEARFALEGFAVRGAGFGSDFDAALALPQFHALRYDGVSATEEAFPEKLRATESGECEQRFHDLNVNSYVQKCI